MKRLALILFVCCWSVTLFVSSPAALADAKAADPEVVHLIQQVNDALLMQYLQPLVDFGPRVTNSNAVHKAGDYIYDCFESMGLEVRVHEWSNWGYSGNNIEGTLPASSGAVDDILLVCAHYDSVSGSPGADDNGSGTAAVMALADIFSDYKFDINIRFVAFDGEEQGLLGSYEYAKEASSNGDRIVAVLNADMIGFALTPSDETKIKVYTNTASNWLLNYTDAVAQDYFTHIDLDVLPSGSHGGSDHASFWNFNYDAIFYHEYNFNDYYHSPQDTIAHMNIGYFVKCTKLLGATLGELAGPYDTYEFRPDDYTLSSRFAAQINFFLDGGTANGNRDYVIFAGASGTSPGTPLPGGSVILPINWDVVTDQVIGAIHSPAFLDFLGTLDGDGLAAAQLNTFGALPPTAVGAVVNFAYVCYYPFDYVSNPVPITIID